jgi:hypothetical protein
MEHIGRPEQVILRNDKAGSFTSQNLLFKAHFQGWMTHHPLCFKPRG